MFSPALVCVSVCVSVCLSVTTITKKIVVPNFVGRFLGGKGRPNRVSLRSVEGCGNDGQKNSAIDFAGVCTLSEYFPSSFVKHSTDSSLC